MPRRLAVFLDGTWNSEKDDTNVCRLYNQAKTGSPDQRTYYDPGVGTRWYDRLTGGAFGHGLTVNVMEEYEWLRTNYQPGDKVYLFGFSRGAFTARAFAGFIARCGLLSPEAPMSVQQIFSYYEGTNKDKRPLYTLEFENRTSKDAEFTKEEELLLEYSKRITIHFQGLWDTVGTLGVPAGNIPRFSSRSFLYLNVRPSVIFEHAYHALAIDEFRGPYRPWLWKRFVPKDRANEEMSPVEMARLSNYEQRWFCGAHSNVGGGYRGNLLSKIPLYWIQEKAASCGLEFKDQTVLRGDEHLEPVVDSYSAFLFGAWKLLTLGKTRFYRPIQRSREERTTGYLDTINEVVDDSVFRKVREDKSYKAPPNLEDWAKRQKVDLRAASKAATV